MPGVARAALHLRDEPDAFLFLTSFLSISLVLGSAISVRLHLATPRLERGLLVSKLVDCGGGGFAASFRAVSCGAAGGATPESPGGSTGDAASKSCVHVHVRYIRLAFEATGRHRMTVFSTRFLIRPDPPLIGSEKLVRAALERIATGLSSTASKRFSEFAKGRFRHMQIESRPVNMWRHVTLCLPCRCGFLGHWYGCHAFPSPSSSLLYSRQSAEVRRRSGHHRRCAEHERLQASPVAKSSRAEASRHAARDATCRSRSGTGGLPRKR